MYGVKTKPSFDRAGWREGKGCRTSRESGERAEKTIVREILATGNEGALVREREANRDAKLKVKIKIEATLRKGRIPQPRHKGARDEKKGRGKVSKGGE